MPPHPLPGDHTVFLTKYRSNPVLNLQKVIMTELINRKYADLIKGTDPMVNARLLSLGDKFASGWLRVAPSRPEFQINDRLFRAAAGFRLGSMPFSRYPRKCACGADVKRGVTHWMNCSLCAGSHTRLHDAQVIL